MAEATSTTANKSPSSTTLRVINVTDTYKFDNFPSLKTLIQQNSNEPGISTTKSIMTGDFLAPYLLSSYDDGEGMMRILNAMPMDMLTWGNHDINDLSDHAVAKRENEYTAGVLINSNMTEHPTFATSACQVEYHVVEISSEDATNTRRVGFLGVITDDPKLFKNCNPGMKKWGVQDPWETLRKFKPILEGAPHHCDLVLPLCHLYEKEDYITCKEFDFPVILSGHDHHVVDEVIEGTRLLKAGSDCDKAIILDISWDSKDSTKQTIQAEHVTVSDYAKDPEIIELTEEIQAILLPLMKTQLAEVPKKFSPLSTKNERGFFGGFEQAMKQGTQCTMVQFILSLMRNALNTSASTTTSDIDDDKKYYNVDACIMKGGNVKCSQDWEPNVPFTLAMLFALWSPEKKCHVFTIPGHVLRGAFLKSYDRPHNGWIHYDDGIHMDPSTGYVTHVGGKVLDPDKLYRIASGNDLQRATDGAVIGDYLKAHPEHMPNPELAFPVSFVIIQYAVRSIWGKLWEILDADHTGTLSKENLAQFDLDGDGNLNKHEILTMIKQKLEWPIHESQDTLVDRIFENVGLDVDASTDEGSSSSLSLEKLNELYQAHQGRPSGKWFFSRASGVYGNVDLKSLRASQLFHADLQALKDLDF